MQVFIHMTFNISEDIIHKKKYQHFVFVTLTETDCGGSGESNVSMDRVSVVSPASPWVMFAFCSFTVIVSSYSIRENYAKSTHNRKEKLMS